MYRSKSIPPPPELALGNQQTPPQQPRTPSPLPNQAPNSPRTPNNNNHAIQVPPTPVRNSPRRATWTTNGRSGVYVRKHPYLDGTPCDENGHDLPPDTPPPPPPERGPDDYTPYASRADFELADFLYREEQMSGKKVDRLMDLWAAGNYDGAPPPYANTKDLHNTIDATEVGDIPWQAFSVTYNGEIPDNAPSWMTASYEVWFRDPLKVMENQIGNPDFAGEMDHAPKQVFGKNGKRQFTDLMSGNWAWDQADIIAQDPETHGAMFAPVIGGSDKTTVSVATGQNDFYPFYVSNGNIQNQVRRGHRNGVTVTAFLSIPKTDKRYEDDVHFRKFRRQLFHTSLTRILLPLKPWMTTPKITRCADGHFRRVVYGLGPYIADYPEQVLLACVVSGWCAKCTALSTNLDDDPDTIFRSHEHTDAMWDAMEGNLKKLWEGYGIVGDIVPFTSQFPRADIHWLLSPDLLHQIIKGTFKDHLVTWVTDYINSVHSKNDAKDVLADIDRRIAAVPSFPGLRRFKEGRGFKQWTGDDSKALMKVYLPAIKGHVPDQMVRALSAFMNFCYLVRRSEIDEDTLATIDSCVKEFHAERNIFIDTGIRDDFSLPRQHSVLHYRHLIQQFGAPNGLCSSITESKHIKAVKEPWRRSNHNEPLGQMLLTNQRLDKLAASRVDFQSRGMLDGACLSDAAPVPQLNQQQQDDEEEEEGAAEGITSTGDVKLAKCPARHYKRHLDSLSTQVKQPKLTEYIRRFLYDQLHPNAEVIGMQAPLDNCPRIPTSLNVKVFHSAVSTYHAPSDLSGIGGMHRERIRACPSWKGGAGRYDCVFMSNDADDAKKGFEGLLVARVLLFFSFNFRGVDYQSALVQWFSTYGDQPCNDTAMWMVEPDKDYRGRRMTSVVNVDSILRNAHLIPVYGHRFIPRRLTFSDSLHAFVLYYVNKYADHQAHEIAF